ncbi:AIPR family protein [Neobacillus fumarioli]|uniref:AIPR family protein n=1 Tax=Neobacillus fumarioli TaxID=105229 RepID=UPI000835AA69|nr:AIPR family protein [Neobacillus fumarioli]
MFNDKVKSHQRDIELALSDANTKFMIVLVYTGQAPLSQDISTDVDAFLEEMNDTSEFARFRSLRQSNIYNMIARGSKGESIKADVVLSNWGRIETPYKAYYGQVAASDVASWWEDYYPQLFAPNIRLFLGDTDVNDGIIATLHKEPEKFWYYNNGITALCSTIKKKPIGGNSRESGIFEIEDLKIVNGAQTAGAIAKAASLYPEKVQLAMVPIRFIELEGSPPDFEKDVTKNTNTQNRIEKRDFAALDPEQERLKEELALYGITYVYKSGEIVGHGIDGFDIIDATVARACYQQGIELTVQAKREIGKLWDDIEKTPYKILFNSSVNCIELWRLVQILRIVERELKEIEQNSSGREKLCAAHGNRFITHLVYKRSRDIINSPEIYLTEDETTTIKYRTKAAFVELSKVTETDYQEAYLASLFKNVSKCKDIVEKYFT